MAVIADTEKAINLPTSTLRAKLKQCEAALDAIDSLEVFAQKGIPIGKNDYPAMKSRLREVNDELVMEEADSLIEKATIKSDSGASTSARTTPLRALLPKLLDLQKLVQSPEAVQDRIQKIEFRINRIHIDGFLEKARKCEFKSDLRGALDQYQEALFHAKNDSVDDFFQSGLIHELEHKIAELAVKVKSGS